MAKDLDQRLSIMLDGVQDMENWLFDTIRQGLAAIDPLHFGQDIAKRMVDAKLGSLAKRTRLLATEKPNEHWYADVLEQMAYIYLIINSLKKIELLPLAFQQDILAYAGVTTKRETVLQKGRRITDFWLVLGQIESEEEMLSFRRTWLYAAKSRQYALILEYIFGNADYELNVKVGDIFEATVAYYEAAYPQRAIIVTQQPKLDKTIKRLDGHNSILFFLESYADALSMNPFLAYFPLCLKNITPVFIDEKFFLVDSQQNIIPCKEQLAWQIIASSGGNVIDIFGEWNGNLFFPMSTFSQQRFIKC